MRRTLVDSVGAVTEIEGGEGSALESPLYMHFDENQKALMDVVLTNPTASEMVVVVEFDYLRVL